MGLGVQHQHDLDAIVASARHWLDLRVGLAPRPDCPVLLADAAQIAAVVGTRGTGQERGLFAAILRARQATAAIVVLRGMSEAHTFGTVVHELTHLWQLEAFPRGAWVDKVWTEGLAAWLQWGALLDLGADAEAAEVVAGADPVTLEGLARVRAVAEAVGQAAVIDEVVALASG